MAYLVSILDQAILKSDVMSSYKLILLLLIQIGQSDLFDYANYIDGERNGMTTSAISYIIVPLSRST